MKKYSSFFTKQVALSLTLSFINGGFVSAQTIGDKKPDKGGSIAVPGETKPALISLPPSQPPPQTLLPVPAVPDSPPTAPPIAPLPTTPIVPRETGVRGVHKPGKGHPGKPPRKQQEGPKKPHRKPLPKHPRKPTKVNTQQKPHAKVPAKKTAKKTAQISPKKTAAKADPAKTKTKIPNQASLSAGDQAGKTDLVGAGAPVSPGVSAEAPRSTEAIEPLQTKTVLLKSPSAAASVDSGSTKTEELKAESPKSEAAVNAAPVIAAPVTAAAKTEAPKGDAAKTEAGPVSKESCQNSAVKKIYDLMLHDDANTLGVMFELTAMRLAKRSLEQTPKPSSFEELTQGNIKALEKKLSQLKSSDAVQKQVQSIYETYGKKNDLETISADFNRMMKKNHDACYFSKNQRLKNEEASSYILAVAVSEKDSGLSDIDAATVWVVEKARAEAEKTDPEHYALGKENGNLLNMSTRVTRYLGRIDDGKNATAEFMADLIAKEEKKLVDVLAGAYTKVKVELTACLLEETRDPKTNTTCKDCAEKALQTFEKDQMGIGEIQRGLLSTVAKSDSLKMEKDLKGKMGDVVYDFSNFAKKGERDVIPPNPPRGKFDACGHAMSTAKVKSAKGKASRSPGQSTTTEAASDAPSEKPITAPSTTDQ